MTNTHYRRLLVRRVIDTHACADCTCSAEVFAVCSSATHGQDAGELADAVGVGEFSGDCLVCQGLYIGLSGALVSTVHYNWQEDSAVAHQL